MTNLNRRLFTSESVTEGHPDKICDQISDSILDAILAADPNARVAAETSVTTGLVLVAGEITTSTYVDIPKVVRETIREIGYTRAKYGFDADTCAVLTSIDEQSADIALGVDQALEAREGSMSDAEIDASVQETKVSCSVTQRKKHQNSCHFQSRFHTVSHAVWQKCVKRSTRLPSSGRKNTSHGRIQREQRAGSCRYDRHLDTTRGRSYA